LADESATGDCWSADLLLQDTMNTPGKR